MFTGIILFLSGIIVGMLASILLILLEMYLKPLDRPVTRMKAEVDLRLNEKATIIRRPTPKEKADKELERRAKEAGESGIMLEDYETN